MATAGNLIRICSVGELPPDGEVAEVQAGDRTLCLARLNGRVSALNDECPHHGGPLGQGTIESGKVVCPWHAYAFDLTTGVCDANARMAVTVFAITVSGDDVLVQL